MVVLDIILSFIGLVLSVQFIVLLLFFILKLIVGTTAVGTFFIINSFILLLKKWWVWLIQLPILGIQFMLFYFEGWSAFIWICLLQLITAIIIFNIQRMIYTQK